MRKSCSFSKSRAMHAARIKIVIDNYNFTLCRLPLNFYGVVRWLRWRASAGSAELVF